MITFFYLLVEKERWVHDIQPMMVIHSIHGPSRDLTKNLVQANEGFFCNVGQCAIYEL